MKHLTTKRGDCNHDVFGFVITKPLQLMVVLALIQQLEKDVKKDFLIVDSFEGSKNVASVLPSIAPSNCKVVFFNDESNAYRHAYKSRYRKLFIDSDVGFVRNITLIKLGIRCPCTTIAVYEEGVGSYRSDLYSGVKKSILKLLGVGVYFGGNWRVRELYLYDPEHHINPTRAKKINITKSIDALLQENWESYVALFNAAAIFADLAKAGKQSKECLIYLSNWDLDKSKIKHLKKMHDTLIIKPHPHIKHADFPTEECVCTIVPAGVPAELLIIWTSLIFEVVTVIHHGSSVERYIDLENVVYRTYNEVQITPG